MVAKAFFCKLEHLQSCMLVQHGETAGIPPPFFMGTSTPLAAAENKRKLS